MKKIALLIAVFASTLAIAQKGSFGLKAGINYNSNGDLIEETTNNAENVIQGADAKVGFHVGAYGKLSFSSLYLRPELVYTKTKSDYNGSSYDISKLDVPVLIGYKVFGPLSIFAGPSFQYILSNDLDIKDIDLKDVENKFSVGLNIGAGVQLGKLGIDVRYERGFSKNEASFIGNNINAASGIEGRVDSRPSQLIFSLSVKL